MYIFPNGQLKILHNVNLNKDYDHTIYFANKNAQTLYFSNVSKVKFSLNNQQYQRKERGWLQVGINQNALWDCTYLMFKNVYNSTDFPGDWSKFVDKWFYAFILEIEYVNENVSRIRFEIDVMQTWMFDYILDKCYVEREHTSSDYLFEHTVEEDLNCGDDYNVGLRQFCDIEASKVMVCVSGRPDPTDPTVFDPAIGTKRTNYFTGLAYQSFDLSIDSLDPNYNTKGLGGLRDYLLDYIAHGFENAVVSVYQYPNFLPDFDDGSVTGDFASRSFRFIATNLFGSYSPKNKKLYCYPYTCFKVVAPSGETRDYKPELINVNFLNNDIYWYVDGNALGIPDICMYPSNYMGVFTPYEYGVHYSPDIACSWVGDQWAIWYAKNGKNALLNQAENIVNFIAGAGIGGIGAATGEVGLMASGVNRMINAGLNSVSNVFDVIKAENTSKATPGDVHGKPNSQIWSLQSDRMGFVIEQEMIKEEYAKIIDEYFSRFGYACKRTKVPNIHARQNWTFTKTVGCEINGNIPSDDCSKIKAIFDHGITFWSNGDNIGNYGDFTNNPL